jgi:hypothetical protein
MDTSEVIRHMVDDILADRGSYAMDKYNNVINVKLADALNDKKIEIASNLGKENADI